MDGRAPSRGRRVALRGLTLLALAVGTVLLLAACGEDQPYSTISPRTENASDIQDLYTLIFWMALVVFIGVQIGIVYLALRYRRRNDDRPEQIHGNTRLEIAWTIIPAIVLLVIFWPTAQTLVDFERDAEAGDMEIEIYGKQWWWEAHYPPELGVITANEIHVPQGQEIVFVLRSNNVVHSFWVPQLTGKLDVQPGHTNRLSVKADVPGEYWGECAEYCGAAHAWMRFKVIVEPQENFDAWVAAYHAGPEFDGDPSTGDVAEVPASFGVCLACHNITGTNATLANNGIAADPKSLAAGPNLSLFGCRDTIGAGILKNDRDNLITWLKATDEVKVGTYMPNYYADGAIDDADVEEIADYLLSLQPPGGCPEQPLGGATPVADDED